MAIEEAKYIWKNGELVPLGGMHHPRTHPFSSLRVGCVRRYALLL